MSDRMWKGAAYKNPLTMEGLIAWLEQQPADGTYDYMDCSGGCLVGLYLGLDEDTFNGFSNSNHPFEGRVYDIACIRPWTFGAALERAREYQALREDLKCL